MCLAYEFYRNKSRPEHAFILLATLNNVDVFGIGRLAQFLIEISHGQEADYAQLPLRWARFQGCAV
jgi:hypothetical protein